MKFFVICFILALILLPIAKLRLKPAQKRSMLLRQRALENGLQVKFAPTPAMQESIAPAQSIRYEYLFTPQEQKSYAAVQLLQWLRSPASESGWQLKQHRQFSDVDAWSLPIEQVLKTFPASVNAVELSAEHIGCYWHEQDDEQAVAQIVLSLYQLKELLADHIAKLS